MEKYCHVLRAAHHRGMWAGFPPRRTIPRQPISSGGRPAAKPAQNRFILGSLVQNLHFSFQRRARTSQMSIHIPKAGGQVIDLGSLEWAEWRCTGAVCGPTSILFHITLTWITAQWAETEGSMAVWADVHPISSSRPSYKPNNEAVIYTYQPRWGHWLHNYIHLAAVKKPPSQLTCSALTADRLCSSDEDSSPDLQLAGNCLIWYGIWSVLGGRRNISSQNDCWCNFIVHIFQEQSLWLIDRSIVKPLVGPRSQSKVGL